jgi:hypothetical protein
MIESRFIDLYYSISQALLGHITNNMLGIAVAYNAESHHLIMRVYLNDKASDVDKENIYSALSEAEGMMNKRISYKAEFIIKPELIVEDKLDFWVFMKYAPSSNEE